MTKIKKKSKFPDKSEFAKGFDAGVRKALQAADEAKRDVMYKGFSMHVLLTLYLLKDKYKSEDKDLFQLNEDMYEYAMMIVNGFLTYDMMKEELLKVHGINFHWEDELSWKNDNDNTKGENNDYPQKR